MRPAVPAAPAAHHRQARSTVLPFLAMLAGAAGCTPVAIPVGDPVPARGTPVRVLQGVDRLEDAFPRILVGKRVGLITNHTGHDRERNATIDLLMKRGDMRLVALFAPEHGIRGELDERVDFETDRKTGLPVHSLYGATNKPTAEMLQGVEALVFDIQDVGVRQYTYTRTMALAMQAAAEQRIPIVVLDRINPIGGEIVEGNIHEGHGTSFVARNPIASRHGLTAGELAQLYNRHYGINADLHVVQNAGWRRDLWLDDTDLPWTKPSPNLPSFTGVIHYPGTVFFEGTNLSEGRGSTHPFEQVGAPWLRADDVTAAMNAKGIPGVRFSSVEFDVAPTARKFGGQRIRGVRMTVTDRQAYRPVATSMRLMKTIREMHPAEFEWRSSQPQNGPRVYTLDNLTGSTRIRTAMHGGTLDLLLVEWERDAERFREMRKPYLLY